ncbi:MAG: hypothetical protein OEP95_09575, partial [Myxococcales bacterium]|nr:hypothetical protein [Myxococcales bacterium]
VVHLRLGSVSESHSSQTYSCIGAAVRRQCRVHDLPIVLHETPLEVVPGKQLRSRLRLGLFRFEESFTLAPSPGEPERTRVGLHVYVPNEMPIVGGTLDRFAVRRLATELGGTHLQALRDWCESSRAPDIAPRADSTDANDALSGAH